MGKRVLITGGSGFLGINMVRCLLQQGVTDIISLDVAPFDYPEQDRVKAVTGDIRDADVVRQAMEGVQWVIHTAAALPLYTREEIMSTDLEGTRNILTAAEAAGVERVVHVSSTAVYGIPDHHPLQGG
jgi:nucleoside-diphosphate-sugar epimerase